MAANATVQVDVKSTADVTGIKEARAALADLVESGRLSSAQFKELTAEFGDFSKKGNLQNTLNELRGVTAETKNATKEADGIGKMFEIGRFQAAALSREIANGAVNARTLGVSLSSLGSVWSVAAIGAFTLFEVINKMSVAQQKMVEDAAKFNLELDRSIEKWTTMAQEAESIGDQVKLADNIHAQILKAQDELKAFTDKVKDQSFLAGVFDIFGTGATKNLADLREKQDEVNKTVAAGITALNQAAVATTEFNAALQRVYGGEGQAVIEEWTKKVEAAQTALTIARVQANIKPSPETEAALAKALELYRFLVAQTKELQDGWDQTTRAEERATAELERMSGAINEIIKKNDEWMAKQIEKDAKAYTDKTAFIQKMNDEAAVRRATGNDEVSINTKVAQLEDNVYRTAIAIKDARGASMFTEKEAQKIAQDQGESLRQQLETTRGLETSQKTYNASLHDAQATLQAIRLAQTVIQGQPFAGADQKQVQMMQAYRIELGLVSAAMTKLKTDIAGGGLDPNVLEQDKGKLQQLVAQYIVLQQKIGAGSKSLQSELQTWSNGFGTTMHQVAGTIEQTVGVALQSLNTYLTTGKFNAQALLQSIIQLGLQLIEQMAIQRIVSMINASANAALAKTAGTAIALAYGPAATAATIATTGAAAAEAPGAVGGALASIMAIFGVGSGTMHSGGAVIRRMHSGGLAHDEVPIIAQEGEIMIQRSVAQQPGMGEFLLGLNSGIFHDGGFIAGERYHRGGFEGGDPLTFADLIRAGPDFSGFSDYDPSARMTLERLAGFGFLGGMGTPGFLQGPTMIPTTFDTGGYPYAIQAALPPSDTGTSQQLHAGFQFKPKHLGGVIGQLHSGGVVPRLHSGGSAIRSQASSGANRSAGVHIYAFTDLKQLTKHMSSREGQKIIFDTVKGRRIDLGIT